MSKLKVEQIVTHLRDPDTLSVGLRVGDRTYWGDCVLDTPGTEELGRSPDSEEQIQQAASSMVGMELDTYRGSQTQLRELPFAALQYGMSQALLHAFSDRRGVLPFELLSDEWSFQPATRPLTFHGSCAFEGDKNLNEFLQARLPSLPAGTAADVKPLLESRGRGLLQYVQSLRQKVEELGDPQYHPVFHFDLHGSLGDQFGEDFSGLCDYLISVERACTPYPLRLESPFLARDLLNQVHLFARLREALESRDSQIQLIADEWTHDLESIRQWLGHRAAHGIHIQVPAMGPLHHTLEAIRLCREAGVTSLLGGSHTEPSARAIVQLGMAAQPDWFVIDPLRSQNSLKVVKEEMNRILHLDPQLPGTGIKLPRNSDSE